MRPLLLWSTFLVAMLGAPVVHSEPLTLVEVLRSTQDQHPTAGAAEARVDEALSSLLSARGAFDLRVFTEGSHAPVGKYGHSRAAVGLKQPTTAMGMTLWTKYENGDDFAPYDGGSVTSQGGKASLGVLLPLLQGRGIDEARMRRTTSQLEVEIAKQLQRGTRASLLSDAAATWWEWVVAGHKLEAYRALVEQAEKRRRFLVEQEATGAIARIEINDINRTLAQRRARLASKELKFQQLSLRLGMFRRDQESRPDPATLDELPPLALLELPEEPDPRSYEIRIGEAPSLQVYESTLQILDTELRWAKNQQAPELDLEVYSSQSLGDPRPYSAIDQSITETTLGGSLTLRWDVQRRKARGKAGALRAKRQAIEYDRKALRDQLDLEVQAQLASLKAQHEVARLSKEATEQARRVSDAERESFELGQSSVLEVNLREQAALTTYLDELDAILEFQKAWVNLQGMLGKAEERAYLPPRGRGDTGRQP